jgi:ubiquinone/menaquinone biosynthesis C-methylase UbiE
MKPNVRFFGLDPFLGEYKRKFPFAQAIGEYLPFPNSTFKCVSFMSSLDHQIEPLISLREARRVLVKNGLLFLWMKLHLENGGTYCWWQKQPPGSVHARHQHIFAERDIKELFEQSEFEWLECKEISRTRLIIGRKQE